ncbi:MAG: polyprenyl diphosphate synthase [bacterium]|nr:polyprenyl diphosphate synthase [bacterium]
MGKVPQCIGIILDGNRRWAKERGLPAFEGHRRGKDNLEPVVLAARDFGIKHIVIYAFSTENWKRTAEEVSYLMEIFEEMAKKSMERLRKDGVAVRFVGQRERFSESLQSAMNDAEQKSSADPKITLWVCLSYGGRAEIVYAARSVVESGEEITEKSLESHLWTAGMPDPDLIIRTSGEHRTSNFLIWQGAYSELFFPSVYWPAFSKTDLGSILKEYAARERRLGT